MDSHIKRRKIKIRNKSLPWIDIGIRKAMNERYKYLKSAQAKPDDNALWKLYKIKRNSVKKMLRKAEAQYWIKLADNASTPKEFWKISNQILGKSTNTRTGSITRHRWQYNN